MNLLLVAGNQHKYFEEHKPQNIELINQDCLNLNELTYYLEQTSCYVENVLILDDAFSTNMDEDIAKIRSFFDFWELNSDSKKQVVVITRNFLLKSLLLEFLNKYKGLRIITHCYVRVPVFFIKEMFNGFNQTTSVRVPDSVEKKEVAKRSTEETKKQSIFDRFKPKLKETVTQSSDDLDTKQLNLISKGVSRTIAITGHRGMGLTSTVVNLAYEASQCGLSVIIVDMDIEYRSLNMYFSSFHERTKIEEEINASLIRTLAKPQEYDKSAYFIKDEMWITSLGYSFNDKYLLDQFFTSGKLVGLLSCLKNNFNSIILDFPLDVFKKFDGLLIHIDTFGLCVSNNLYSIISTIRNIEEVFSKENISYFNAKSRLIVTQYNVLSRFNGDLLIPEKVNEILTSGLNANFIYPLKIAGQVPYSTNFDSQIETDIPVVNASVEHEKAFKNILLRLMEGTK